MLDRFSAHASACVLKPCRASVSSGGLQLCACVSLLAGALTRLQGVHLCARRRFNSCSCVLLLQSFCTSHSCVSVQKRFARVCFIHLSAVAYSGGMGCVLHRPHARSVLVQQLNHQHYRDSSPQLCHQGLACTENLSSPMSALLHKLIASMPLPTR